MRGYNDTAQKKYPRNFRVREDFGLLLTANDITDIHAISVCRRYAQCRADKADATHIGTFACRTFLRDTKASKRANLCHEVSKHKVGADNLIF
ncbi:MAG: hypothetical protein HYR67_16740 [Bacteroidetes bacterium]|nr:hypothetical protein [Bacteroidota bacterium]